MIYWHKKRAKIENISCWCVYYRGIGTRELAYFIDEKDADLFLSTIKVIYEYIGEDE